MNKPAKLDSSRLNQPGAANLPDDTELDEAELDVVTGGTNDSQPTSTISNVTKKQHDANMAAIKNIKI